MTYVIERMRVGHLRQEETSVVKMLRSTFLELVEEELADGDYDTIADRVRESARTIKSFPRGKWIDENRGCGCLVGEMLIAAHVVDFAHAGEDAEKLAREEMAQAQRNLNVMQVLRAREPHASALEAFGLDIDARVSHHLGDEGLRLLCSGVVTGDKGYVTDVHAILIEDEVTA